MTTVDPLPLSELRISSAPNNGLRFKRDDDYRKRIMKIQGKYFYVEFTENVSFVRIKL